MAEGGTTGIKLETILQCVKCSQTLDQPLRLRCLHSYCQRCLYDIPTVDMRGRSGWRCQSCDIYTSKEDVKEDKLLEKLIVMEEERKRITDRNCGFCRAAGKADFFCTNCRKNICGRCKEKHESKPDTANHDYEKIDQDDIKDVIDQKDYCPKHCDEIMANYCEACNRMICAKCQPDHKEHDVKTSEEVLKKQILDMDKYSQNINVKLGAAGKQLQVIDNEIENVKEIYAKWRIDSDEKLEILINRLKAAKSVMEESVNIEESWNLELLKGIRNNLHHQVEGFRIASTISNLTKMKTRNQSQLHELQNGLLEQMREMCRVELGAEKYQVNTPFIDETLYNYTDNELQQMIRPVKYEHVYKCVDQSGSVLYEMEHMCHDLNHYLKQTFKQTATVALSNRDCSRIQAIDDLVCVTRDHNTIQQFNTAGKLVQTCTDANRSIVVKPANNGEIVAAGFDGLYITNKDFSDWNFLQYGSFSDIAVHGNKFSALEYKQCKVLTFEFYQENDEFSWKLVSSFNLDKDHRAGLVGNSKANLIVDKYNNVIVGSKNALHVYSNAGDFVTSMTLMSKENTIVGMDAKGNVMLCDAYTGRIYCINISQCCDSTNMEQYNICEKHKPIRDMTVDRKGNLWVLYGNVNYSLAKYEAS